MSSQIVLFIIVLILLPSVSAQLQSNEQILDNMYTKMVSFLTTVCSKNLRKTQQVTIFSSKENIVVTPLLQSIHQITFGVIFHKIQFQKHKNTLINVETFSTQSSGAVLILIENISDLSQILKCISDTFYWNINGKFIFVLLQASALNVRMARKIMDDCKQIRMFSTLVVSRIPCRSHPAFQTQQCCIHVTMRNSIMEVKSFTLKSFQHSKR